MRLCVCKREGDEGEEQGDAQLHLRFPECPAGDERVDASPAPGHRCGRPRAQPDQRLEGSYYHGQQEVRPDQSRISGIAVVVAKGPVSLILRVSRKKNSV